MAFVLGMIVLLGISTVLTGNKWISWMNDLIIFVLLVGILLHNFAQDTGWNFGKYLAEIVAAVCRAVCFIREAVCGWRSILPQQKTKGEPCGLVCSHRDLCGGALSDGSCAPF